MKRIYDFYSFSKLYEDEGGEEKKVLDFQSLVQMTLSNILECYKKQTSLTKDPYDFPKQSADYDSVVAAPGVESLKKILDKIKSLAADDAKDTADSWTKAGNSFLGVLSKIYELLPNSKDDINKIISEYITQSKESLVGVSKDNPATSQLLKLADANKEGDKKLNASIEYFYDGIVLEGALDFLRGKKAILRDISSAGNQSGAGLDADVEQNKDLKDFAAGQKAEIEKIQAEIGKLSGLKNREIKDEDVQKLRDRLAEIDKKTIDKKNELANKSETTKDASPLFVKATEDLKAASKKDLEYRKKKDDEKAAENERKKGEEAEKESEKKIADEKKEIGFEKTITKKDIGGKKSETVQKIQKLIDRRLGKKIKDSEVFKKFSEGKYAGDGYFGDNTEKVIKGIKAGLGMKSDDSDITEELIDKILSLKESESFKYGRFKSFEAFESESPMNEKYYKDVKFDLDKFLEVADGKKSDKKEEVKVTPEEIISTLKKEKEEVEKKSSKEIEELASKDFKVSDTGKEVFLSVAGISWDEYSKQDEDKRKEMASKVIASLNLKFGIPVEKVVKNLLQAK